MTFDEWWEENNYSWLGYDGVHVDYHSLMRKAWEVGSKSDQHLVSQSGEVGSKGGPQNAGVAFVVQIVSRGQSKWTDHYASLDEKEAREDYERMGIYCADVNAQCDASMDCRLIKRTETMVG